jgi:predicted aspartyl protease
VLRNHSVPVAPLPIGDSNGRTIDGLIGADVLARFDVDFDLPGGAVRLYRAAACATAPPWSTRSVAIPANRTRSGRLFVPVRVNGQLLLAMLDSGFSSTTITTRAAARLGVTPAMLAADPAAGVTRGIDLSDQPNRWHRFAEVQIAGEVFHNRQVIVAELAAADIDMLIGTDFLAERRLWLAYSATRVFVERPGGAVVSALP